MKLKWDISGKGDEAWGSGMAQYEGPPPPRGSYVAKIKRMTVGRIKSQGENHGKPRISVLLEIVSGAGANGPDDPEYKYYGAPVWDGLNIIKSQTGRTNGFLHALTDGSEEAKRAVETAFWPPNGPRADKVTRRDGTEDVHIIAIGKYNIGSPDGSCLVRIVTKMGKDVDGNPRPEIGQYLPYNGPKPASAVNGSSSDDEEDDDLLEAEVVDDDDEIVELADDDEDVVDLDEAEEAPPF